jgi:hypothetical protein
MNTLTNVLLYPSGSLVAQEIYDSLKYIRNIKIYGTDFDQTNFSFYYMENYIEGCPFIRDEENAIKFLKKIIVENNIQVIFPCFDSAILLLKKFEDYLNVNIIAPDLDVIKICNSKLETYNQLKEYINTPKMYKNTDKRITFPVYSKPIIGYGSRDHKIINNVNDLQNIDIENNLILEYLSGDEFTIDCFSNFKGELLYFQPRKRIKTSNGMCILGKTVDIDVKKFAETINNKIKMSGAWFFQVKYNDNNELKLLEIACRIPGAMCINRVKGINFPYLSILNSQKIDVNPILYNDMQIICHKVYTNKYYNTFIYNEVFCDLDDTIIINGKINCQLISFLFSCLNKNIKINLITRNKNPQEILDKYRLNIFDRIISISDIKISGYYEDKKSNYIQNINAIFIDDSFIERQDVKNKCDILCFSPSEIELLL